MFDPHPQCAGVAVPSSALRNILRARQSHFEKKSANIDPPSRKSLQRIGNTWKDEWLMSSRGVSREQKAARDSLQNPFQGLSHSTSMRKSKGRDVLSNFLRNARGSARACVEFAARRVPSQATVSAPDVDVVRDVGDLQRTRQPPLPRLQHPPPHTQTPLHNIIAVIIASENLVNEDDRVVHCFTLTLEVCICQSLRVYRIHAD
ncbi:hypothetical protein C0Q70_13792 [Pomacea canaliculata]|uniref:Uncharacterized protein n=1 Tax=Pomacea canaliculata TaxID=400727 RepID=A0A2T7NY88_POMCA|nr:hypothetical protein C0Q70_13792 [Pomacea canaliculata]